MRGLTLILGQSSFDRRNARKIPFSFLLLSSFLSFVSFCSLFLLFLFSLPFLFYHPNGSSGEACPHFPIFSSQHGTCLLPFSFHFLFLFSFLFLILFSFSFFSSHLLVLFSLFFFWSYSPNFLLSLISLFGPILRYFSNIYLFS